MKYRVAVVGTGYMARKQCDVLASCDEASLYALCSTERSKAIASELAARFGFVRNTTDYDSILADPALDIVLICTPDSTHSALVRMALQAGKHVFCEKPLARTEREFREIRGGLDTTSSVLQVGMNCRFREQYSIPKQMVSCGDLGELRLLRGTYIYNVVSSVRAKENAWTSDHSPRIFQFMHGGGIHCLDLLRWLGGDIRSVFARGRGFELAKEYGADVFTVSLEFASGALGELTVAASAFRPNDFSLELWLSRGSIVGRRVFRRDGDGIAAQEDEIRVTQEVVDLALQYHDFVRAIESHGVPLNSFEEAYANFRVLRAVEQSIDEERLVYLSEDN